MQSCKIKKGRQLQFNGLQCNHEQIKKGDNSNLIGLQCNHKLLFLKGGNSNLIDCNAFTKKN